MNKFIKSDRLNEIRAAYTKLEFLKTYSRSELQALGVNSIMLKNLINYSCVIQQLDKYKCIARFPINIIKS